MVRPTGIEPVHLAPEASALSPELRARHDSKAIVQYLCVKDKLFYYPFLEFFARLKRIYFILTDCLK